ncbi:MAG TPA: CAP domain-containing protein [Solirubrobacteraceae bacterium]
MIGGYGHGALGGHRHHKHRAATAIACQDTTLVPTSDDLDRIAGSTVCIVNAVRVAAGRTPLSVNAALVTAAAGHSADMVAGDYVGQVGPSGGSLLGRLETAGYLSAGSGGFSIAENVSASVGGGTPAATVSQWMGSPEARANILDPAMRETGIGIVDTAPGVVGTGPGVTYTEDFGATSPS